MSLSYVKPDKGVLTIGLVSGQERHQDPVLGPHRTSHLNSVGGTKCVFISGPLLLIRALGKLSYPLSTILELQT